MKNSSSSSHGHCGSWRVPALAETSRCLSVGPVRHCEVQWCFRDERGVRTGCDLSQATRLRSSQTKLGTPAMWSYSLALNHMLLFSIWCFQLTGRKFLSAYIDGVLEYEYMYHVYNKNVYTGSKWLNMKHETILRRSEVLSILCLKIL